MTRCMETKERRTKDKEEQNQYPCLLSILFYLLTPQEDTPEGSQGFINTLAYIDTLARLYTSPQSLQHSTLYDTARLSVINKHQEPC